jgi:two-component system, chemotaxis family, CheB/CheR fusion protein
MQERSKGGREVPKPGGETGSGAAARKTAKRRPRQALRRSFPIVGIGASAGGLEAFTALLEHLPANTGMAFVLVQHLDPTHKTILPEILSRSTAMPVALANDEMALEPDHVYVSPPGQDMTLFHGRLSLTERQLVGGMHLPIDHFLRSLALDQRSHAIGVILSGSASDGALGIAALKAEGGITFAQEPSSARYDGMPTAAIHANAVDMVLEPEGIAKELERLGKHPYVLEDGEAAAVPTVTETDADWMNKIFVLLRGIFGVDFSVYRMSTIRRRIDRRMALYRLDSLMDYFAYLRERPAEVEDLYHDILIMVTEFFREPEAFEALASVILPKIIAEKRDGQDQIRIWVPGCSTGEEPYSIALTVVRALQQAERELQVKIFATDISGRDIEHARLGVYADNKYSAVPESYHHYFSHSDGGHQISKGIRDLVIFARHDVTADPPFSQLDLISCRNLLIYLGPEAQERVIPTFHYALRPQGFLLLGSAESIGPADDLFASLDAKHKIFAKKPGGRRLPALTYARLPGVGPSLRDPAAALIGFERRFDPQRAAEELLLSEFVPPSVTVDEGGQILQFRGQTDEFLQHGSGRASLDVLEMAREGLSSELRRAFEQARAAGKAVRREAVRYRAAGELTKVALQVLPFKGAADEPYYVILFEKLTAAEQRQAQPEAAAGEQSEIGDLRRELLATRDYMQALVHDKEAALEELRAANEEIQSSNEELQSMNEELETAKEELQSTNEELRTVNEELENRNLQLSRANDDLNNLLRAVNVPTIIVGRDLRIRRFTPGTERVMNLIASDIGRPITDIAVRLEVPDLGEMLENAIDNVTAAEREMRDEHGRWYSVRVRPYQTDENRIEGAVITLVDVDELRRALAGLRQSAELSEVVNQVLSALQADQPLERMMPVLLARSTEVVGAQAAAVLLRRDDHWLVRHAHNLAKGAAGRRLSDEEMPQAAIAAATRAPVSVVSAAGSSPLLPEGFGGTAVVVVPLITSGRVGGVMMFAWQAPGAPDEAQVDFIAKVGALASLALCSTCD